MLGQLSRPPLVSSTSIERIQKRSHIASLLFAQPHIRHRCHRIDRSGITYPLNEMVGRVQEYANIDPSGNCRQWRTYSPMSTINLWNIVTSGATCGSHEQPAVFGVAACHRRRKALDVPAVCRDRVPGTHPRRKDDNHGDNQHPAGGCEVMHARSVCFCGHRFGSARRMRRRARLQSAPVRPEST
jgi:hypothetical protein